MVQSIISNGTRQERLKLEAAPLRAHERQEAFSSDDLSLRGQSGRERCPMLRLVFNQGILAISLCAAAPEFADGSRRKVMEAHDDATGRNTSDQPDSGIGE